MEEDNLIDMKEAIVTAGRDLFNKGILENNEGNISLRVSKKDEMLITPTGNNYQIFTANQVVHMKFDGTSLSSGKLPSTEAKMHALIYESRPKVKSIIHTHSTYASMLSIIRKNIPIIMEEQLIYLGGSIEISPYGEAHTNNIGESALTALGYKNGALLANHGVIVCGKSIQNAIKNAELVEKFAKVYWGALQVGKPYILDNEPLDKFRDMFKKLFSSCPRSMLKDL
ncbi:MAG: class II aldolase/adducin family protein [Promethearchaeota archaeon]|nr:MAG: class II aldolase/adducin family protein [Candidatus Lokiarchaeota archaeon]